ncbi:transcription termination/antitermination protein NusA [Patescibacteria group bacterium]|nr:transcription termination/antitermination protein NusA [Patescibacteria group bacterium]
MQNSDLFSLLDSIERERGISRVTLLEGIREALISAFKKRHGYAPRDLRVVLADEKGQFKVLVKKVIVKKVKNIGEEISLGEAKKITEPVEIGGEIEVEVNLVEFSRIAASTGKYVMMQQIVEMEKDKLYQEFKEREGEVTSGTVRYQTNNFILVDLGKVEGILPERECLPNRRYKQGERLLAYILRVTREPKGPRIVLSQTHPNFLRRLFEMEVPEVEEGIVKIWQVKRDPGRRAKVVVESKDEKIDPVGACVGLRGSRIKAVLREVGPERIDIIKYSDNPAEFIKNSLKPAEIREVKINEEKREAKVIVSDDQLSLAIGANGENVKLAAKLTNWQIDIRSLGQIEKEADVLKTLPGIGEKTLRALREKGLLTLKDIKRGGVEGLSGVSGVGPKTAKKILEKVKEINSQGEKQ